LIIAKAVGVNQKHDTEETEEAEDLGVCVAGENSPQAAEILVDGNTGRWGRNQTFTAGSAEIAEGAGKATAGLIFKGQNSSQASS
jgi:hypothetical protein